MLRFSAALAVVLTVFPGVRSSGQNADVLERWYGTGVHAFFAGDLPAAEQAFTEAINGGTRDPRAYFFRGLTYLQLGRMDEAKADMQVGAALEARDSDGRYPVSRSLERIQGGPRQLLERYRRAGRSNVYQERQTRWHERYETLRRREEDVLRRQIVVPLDQFAVPLKDDVTVKPAVNNPPAKAPTGAGAPSAKPADQPVKPPIAKPARRPAPTKPPAKTPAKAPLPDPFADASSPPTPKPAVKSTAQEVPEGERVPAPRLGRILTRVLGKSLPDEDKVSGAGKQPSAGTARPGRPAAPSTPATDTDVFGTAGPKKSAPETGKSSSSKRRPPAGKKATQTGKGQGGAAKNPAVENPFLGSDNPFGDDANKPANGR